MSTSSPSPAAVPGPLAALGRACHHHRWATLIGWVAAVACLIALWVRFGAPSNDSFGGSDPGQAVLARHFPHTPGDTLTLAVNSRPPIRSAAVRADVARAIATFERQPHVTMVLSPYQGAGQISADGHIAYARVDLGVPGTQVANSEALALMADARAASGHGVTFSLGGDVVDLAETPYGGPSDGIGLAAAAIVLAIGFGSVLAMGLPILTALLGIGAGLSLIALLGHVVPAPSFSPIVASMIGLGVGVDYALFILTRFREALRAELADPGPPAGPARRAPAERAIARTMATAGRSVLTAGATVVISMLGLLVLRQPLMNGVAVAAAATVAMVLLGSLTLLPALIGFTGLRLAGRAPGARPRVRWPAGRVDAGHRGRPDPAAARWARVVQRRPALWAAASAVVILALAAPALGMKLSMPDESAQARNTMGYASYATMARGFGPGFDAPLIVAATLPAGATPAARAADVARLAGAIRSTPGVAALAPAVLSHDRRAAMLIAYPATGEQNPATDSLVHHLQADVLPAATAGRPVRAYLTGPNAGNVAFADLVGQRLPWLIGAVVLASMVLLTVVFRSVTVAVKAALMNLLSISAAFGVLVLIAQHGWLRGLFGFPEPMPVTTWVPMFLFVILFGLSMDYEVFLLSRIREAYDATGDNSAAVAGGLAAAARVITAAAAIMVVVFLSFVLGANVSVKQIGLGLATAVLIDATLVRMALVPAVMELLGRANWWLPRPLARILPGPARAAAAPATDAPLAASRE